MGYEKLSRSVTGEEHLMPSYRNQDHVLVCDGNFGFIADGMSGQGDGAFASAFAVERAREVLSGKLGYFSKSKDISLENSVINSVEWAHKTLGTMVNAPRVLNRIHQKVSKEDTKKAERWRNDFRFREGNYPPIMSIDKSGTSLVSWAIDKNDNFYLAGVGNILAIKFDGKSYNKLTEEQVVASNGSPSFLGDPLKYALFISRAPLAHYVGQDVSEQEIHNTSTHLKKGDSVLLCTKGLIQSVSIWAMVYALGRDDLSETQNILLHHYAKGDRFLMRARSDETGLDLETSRNELAGMKDCTFTVIRRT